MIILGRWSTARLPSKAMTSERRLSRRHRRPFCVCSILRMLNKEEFDASEMSLSNYMIALGHGDSRFRGDSGFSVPGVSAFLYLGQHQRRYPGTERSYRQTGRHCGLLDDGIALRSRYAQARV